VTGPGGRNDGGDEQHPPTRPFEATGAEPTASRREPDSTPRTEPTAQTPPQTPPPTQAIPTTEAADAPPERTEGAHRASGAEQPGGAPPKTASRRSLYIVAGIAVLAVVALVAVLLTRPSADTGGGGQQAEPAGPTSATVTPSAGTETSAATILGWGEPSRVDEFDGPRPAGWNLYNGKGHDGNGRRTPDAVSVEDGILTITGDSQGNTGGMALYPGQQYGRWEGRVKLPDSDPTYHALLLLWPDAEDWPEGGEVDFMEATGGDRQDVSFFLHYSEDNKQDEGEVAVDATQWHNWAVEWTPDHIIGYLDGQEWYRNENKDHLPPRPMHLTIQLDWFPEDGDANNVRESEMQVDWVKEYPLR